MRLIDADKLIDALGVRDCHKYKNPKAYDTLMLYEILGVIEDQPTAYDVDKVVEELEYEMLGDTANDRFDRGFNSAIHMCIKIIKEAVQNDE